MIYLKSSVGIEFRNEDLLISCLKRNFSGGAFTSFLRIPGFRQMEPAQVRRELDAFFKKERAGRENIVIGLPRKDVSLRYLDLPKEVEDNLKQVMLYQVQSFEPTDEEKFYYDYALLKGEKSDKKLRVLVIMIRKSSLDGYLQTMKQFGIRPTLATTGSVAVANMLLGSLDGSRDKTFVLADLKPDGIELAVLRGGSLVYGRDAARGKDVSPKQLLLQEMELAAGKVRLDPEETIEGIFVSGEESEQVARDLQEEIPGCGLTQSRLRFQVPPQNRAFLAEAVSSLGLAYAGLNRRLPLRLNLLPAEQRRRQKRWAYIPTIILGAALLAETAGFASRARVQQKLLSQKLDQEIAALETPAARVRDLRTKMLNVEKKVVSFEDLLNRHDQNLEILRELTEKLPADTYLTMYRNQDCTLQLQGQSPPATSSDLILTLEKSPLLRDVTISQTIFRNPQTGKDTFTFSAKCEK